MSATYADYGIDLPPGAHGETRVICPRCGGDKRSKRENWRKKDLVVNVEKGAWDCKHCDFKGGLGTGIDTGYGARLKSYERPKPISPAPETAQERMYRWFEEQRHIPREVIDRNGVTAVTNTNGVEAIAFPYYRDNQHIHTTYRTYDKMFWQSKDTESVFYGLDDITPDVTEVVLCEGQCDKLAFAAAGIHNCLSVPSGAPNADSNTTTVKMPYLEATADLFGRMTRVYLAADADRNGKALNDELARRIGKEKCWIVTFPEGMKDANDVLREFGPPMLAKCIEEARPYPVEGIFRVNDIYDRIYDLYRNGPDEGIRIGMRDLDNHYRPRVGALTVITGHSSHGKSEWLDHILVRIARKHHWPIGIFSPENQPIEEHALELAEIYHAKRRAEITEDELHEATAFLDEHFMFILPEEPTIESLINRARTVVLQSGMKGLVLDPWNEIETMRPSHVSETEYVSQVLTQLKTFAQSCGVHVWLVAHPTKYQGWSEGGKEPIPTLNNISTSGNFRNKADYGVVIWRDVNCPEEPSICHVQKVRFSPTGKPGKVYFLLDIVNRRIMEVDRL